MRVLVAAVGVAMLGLAPAAPAGAQTTTPLVVDATAPVGLVRRELGGLGWHFGGTLRSVAQLHPKLVRVDASLEQVSPAPGVLHLDALRARVAEVRAIGAEPLVILAYMPAWLGAPRAGGRDPTKVAPADYDAWQQVVHDVVLALATAPAPARRFEAWNEPDVPIFWQDLPQAFNDTVVRSAMAIAAVERETGFDLAFGGPATAVADPVYLASFLSAFRDPSLPLDFVSWHYYGNLPFFGPDGTEFGETNAVQPVVGRPNPLTSPSAFGPQVGLVRQMATAALAGSGRPAPSLLLDEWNLSSGGFDRRHDTNVGAAFDAGVLAELQDAGLDASIFFRADDTRTAGGDHGLVRTEGRLKPAWWTFWLWQQLAQQQLTVDGTSEGLWAVASADADRVTLMVSSFSASQPTARTLEVDVKGLDWSPVSATVRRLDADHSDASAPAPLAGAGTHVTVELPAQAVAFVELRRSAPGSTPSDIGRGERGAGGAGALPGTGGAGPSLGLLLMAMGLALAAIYRRASRRQAG